MAWKCEIFHKFCYISCFPKRSCLWTCSDPCLLQTSLNILFQWHTCLEFSIFDHSCNLIILTGNYCHVMTCNFTLFLILFVFMNRIRTLIPKFSSCFWSQNCQKYTFSNNSNNILIFKIKYYIKFVIVRSYIYLVYKGIYQIINIFN